MNKSIIESALKQRLKQHGYHLTDDELHDVALVTLLALNGVGSEPDPVFENGQTLAEVQAATSHNRYFVDHEAVHDRETGMHVYADEAARLLNARSAK